MLYNKQNFKKLPVAGFAAEAPKPVLKIDGVVVVAVPRPPKGAEKRKYCAFY